VHEALELVEYLCPACGILHAVEVEERDAGPLQDVKLAATAFVAGKRSLVEGAA
jgi:acetone carboxylase gamma subunit